VHYPKISANTVGGWIMSRTFIWALLLMLVIPGLALGQGEAAKVFEQRCAPCHREDGTGMAGKYPPLVKHAPEVLISSRSYLIKVLLYGLVGKIDIEGATYDGGVMPSFYSYKDKEIAAVLNYVLTSWGNDKLLPKDFKPISADEIKAERGKNIERRQVYQIRKELKLVK